MSARRCTCERSTCRLCWLWAHNADYRAAWGGNPADATPASDPWRRCATRRVEPPPAAIVVEPPPAVDCCPGSELKSLLAELGLGAIPGCNCDATAEAMDRVGVAGVRRDRDKLAKLLSVAAGRVGLAKKLRAAGRALRRGIAFKLDLCDLYGSLIDEACRRAERERIALSNHSQG